MSQAIYILLENNCFVQYSPKEEDSRTGSPTLYEMILAAPSTERMLWTWLQSREPRFRGPCVDSCMERVVQFRLISSAV